MNEGGVGEDFFLKLINTEEAPKQVGLSASDKCFFLLGDRWLQVARATVSFQDGTSTYKQTPKVEHRITQKGQLIEEGGYCGRLALPC